MCVCIIKLHITAQSGPVILVLICHTRSDVCLRVLNRIRSENELSFKIGSNPLNFKVKMLLNNNDRKHFPLILFYNITPKVNGG